MIYSHDGTCNANRDNRQDNSVTSSVTTTLQRRGIMLTMAKRELGKHYIREWRKKRGLSLRRLAERMETEPGVLLTSHANIQRIEKYEQPYSQDILEAIAEALEVSVTDLLTVDPTKDGEVVDLLRLINDQNRDQAVRVLRALAQTG
ncbi:helix-turn-helix transcriptional regulator [Mesorhizobium sp. B2-3-2]|nr:helix-turn-helix transcriptional regulator [Mesorhizobium sp. B2-3-2]